MVDDEVDGRFGRLQLEAEPTACGMVIALDQARLYLSA
jgi:hypothetical protein